MLFQGGKSLCLPHATHRRGLLIHERIGPRIRYTSIGGLNLMNREISIRLLNKSVADELQAVHQYMYFHFHLDDQGFTPLAMLFKRIAIMEMGHVEKLAERILFLKGDVEMKLAGPVQQIKDPSEILKCARGMEEQSGKDYNQMAIECGTNADAASKQIFEALVNDEETHYDTFDKQLDNIKRFGLNYLALQSFNTAPATGPEGAAE
jgi:bacterioferritin